MCGACGGPPPDPDGARVAGPRRRAAVARAVQAARPQLVVRAVPGGWTVAERTGRTRVARTLTELLAATDGPDLRHRVLAAADLAVADPAVPDLAVADLAVVDGVLPAGS